jgi:hypothetical protein
MHPVGKTYNFWLLNLLIRQVAIGLWRVELIQRPKCLFHTMEWSNWREYSLKGPVCWLTSVAILTWIWVYLAGVSVDWASTGLQTFGKVFQLEWDKDKSLKKREKLCGQRAEERLSDMRTLNPSFTARWQVLCLTEANFWAGTKYDRASAEEDGCSGDPAFPRNERS